MNIVTDHSSIASVVNLIPPVIEPAVDPINEENVPEDTKATPDEIAPQGEKSTYPSEMNDAEDLSSSSAPRLPAAQKTARTLEKLKKGFTRIPNSILIEMVNGNLSKAEMKALLLIARYTISFNDRKTASLSKNDFIRYTKIQGSTVLDALASLEKKNLIVKIKGDQFHSNQIGLRFDSEPSPEPDKPSGDDTNQSKGEKLPQDKKSPQGAKDTYPEGVKSTSPADAKSTHPSGRKSTHFKESFSKNSFKESLSKSDCPLNDPTAKISTLPNLERHFEKVYFSSIRAPKVLREERGAFRAIIGRNGDLTLGEFLECCAVVAKQRDKQGNEIIKKFVWMSGGFDSILKSARAAIRERQRKAEFATEGNCAKVDVTSPAPVEVAEPESESESAPVESLPDKSNKGEILAQIEQLSSEISRFGNRYVFHLGEGDLCQFKALRKARLELHEQNGALLNFDPISFWSSEASLIKRLKESVSAFHRDGPLLTLIESKYILRLVQCHNATVMPHWRFF